MCRNVVSAKGGRGICACILLYPSLAAESLGKIKMVVLWVAQVSLQLQWTTSVVQC